MGLTFSAMDHQFMALALQQAEQGRNLTTPNPSVGCVLVKDGRLIGAGHTQAVGGPHAEPMALRDAIRNGEVVQGATAYVTLEPCAHFGRTPPCANALIDAGIVRVVAALVDPHPLVAGKGLAILREAGIVVESGLMAADARESLKGFLSRIERNRPWLRLKIASSLDGKTALANGDSQWITGAAARADVQRLRARSCAMLTGSGTVLKDDPQLTVRDVDIGRQPMRVVLDSRGQMPVTAKLLSLPGKVLVVVANAPASHQDALSATGAEVISLPDGAGRIDLAATLNALADRGVNEVTVEAGARLNGAWLRSGLVDELVLYQAPVLLGSDAAGLADFSLARLADKFAPAVIDLRQIGADIRYTLRF